MSISPLSVSRFRLLCGAASLSLTCTEVLAQNNPDSLSAQVTDLPALLTDSTGQTVTTVENWEKSRRPEILELFRSEVFGRTPVDKPNDLAFELIDIDEDAMQGAATKKIVKISYSGPHGKGSFYLNLFVPNQADSAVPGFLLINNRDADRIDHTRKEKFEFWPAEEIVARGYAAIAFNNKEIAPDDKTTFVSEGAYAIFSGKDERRDDDWGALGTWAWAASRAMDYLQQDTDLDAERIALVGHSRGGKTALWAGAQDERFAMVVSNDSGTGGARLIRYPYEKAEPIAIINKNFPHWFAPNYLQYNDQEKNLPFDHHQLVSLIAPRLAYIASARDDDWAGPEGEFLSAWFASPVYELYGKKGLSTADGEPAPDLMPALSEPLHGGQIGYHIRSGKHDLNLVDWGFYMDFADRHLKAQPEKSE